MQSGAKRSVRKSIQKPKEVLGKSINDRFLKETGYF
jgi:hypothetical protein